MNLGTITTGDIGNWYLGFDGMVLQLKDCMGPLLYCSSPQGYIYYPIHDVKCQLSAKEAERRISKLNKLNTHDHEQPRTIPCL